MSGAIAYKRNHTTRIPVSALVADAALALGGKTIEVKLQAGETVVTLAIGSGVGLAGGAGEFWYDVTQANLTTLGDPASVLTVINIWNADNTLALTGTGQVNVAL